MWVIIKVNCRQLTLVLTSIGPRNIRAFFSSNIPSNRCKWRGRCFFAFLSTLGFFCLGVLKKVERVIYRPKEFWYSVLNRKVKYTIPLVFGRKSNVSPFSFCYFFFNGLAGAAARVFDPIYATICWALLCLCYCRRQLFL